MFTYRQPQVTQRFSPKNTEPLARYGLPSNVQYCKKCVISNQRPMSTAEITAKSTDKKKHIKFDPAGICDACNYSVLKSHSVNWDQRKEELLRLCDKFRRGDGSHDCIVPGSGGKDSLYASYVLKNEFGMNPLTVTWAPHLYTDWGWSNFQNWMGTGIDNILYTPNSRVHRLLTRLAIENFLHPFQPFMIGQKTLAPRLAREQGIQLVFYGENEAEYGNLSSENFRPRRAKKYHTVADLRDVRLGGLSVSRLIEDFDIPLSDLRSYLPVIEHEKKGEDDDSEVHYLGYYLRWHPQDLYYFSRSISQFRPAPERNCGTYSKYSSLDDKLDDLHYYTTGIKFGLGRASYDAAQEIRNDDITRAEGVALVRRFDHEYPSRFLPELLDYLSLDDQWFPNLSNYFECLRMDQGYFNSLCDSFRSEHLWIHRDGAWKLRTPLRAR